eukprot:CAMPEP_0194697844 /NCGR_PEP_ID=MMETSP0295-20121207/23692_1 /TAXON_ID=39354 /ORGANISM="Heterosigma akashiwo, Strain CCMP2393" /LENGTH=275 /DNA_ID=CAMNT_0039590641 /DNA_START=739 /DNA_END=1562 /DNA_ORIENTATION=+
MKRTKSLGERQEEHSPKLGRRGSLIPRSPKPSSTSNKAQPPDRSQKLSPKPGSRESLIPSPVSTELNKRAHALGENQGPTPKLGGCGSSILRISKLDITSIQRQPPSQEVESFEEPTTTDDDGQEKKTISYTFEGKVEKIILERRRSSLSTPLPVLNLQKKVVLDATKALLEPTPMNPPLSARTVDSFDSLPLGDIPLVKDPSLLARDAGAADTARPRQSAAAAAVDTAPALQSAAAPVADIAPAPQIAAAPAENAVPARQSAAGTAPTADTVAP